ncbi:hypothetical protein F7725_012208, partial [Dissostichus mawsoni]
MDQVYFGELRRYFGQFWWYFGVKVVLWRVKESQSAAEKTSFYELLTRLSTQPPCLDCFWVRILPNRDPRPPAVLSLSKDKPRDKEE